MSVSSNPRTITRIEGPPGSGKSRLLAKEAVRLFVQDGIPAETMLLLVVSGRNKRRLAGYIQEEARRQQLQGFACQVETLDDWLLSLLNRGADNQSGNWALLKDLELRLIVRALMISGEAASAVWQGPMQGNALAGLVVEFIRRCQLQGVSPVDIQAEAESERLNVLCGLYQALEQVCGRANLLTYPQLIRQVSQLPLLASLNLPQAVLVDDAQELSATHFEFFRKLSAHLVLAGNEKLSVRGYRGAAPELFQSAFQSEPVSVKVQQSTWRENTAVLTLLNRLLPEPIWEEQTPNLEQLEKSVQFGYYSDPEAETLALADQIIALVGREVVSCGSEEPRPMEWGDCAILLRSERYRPYLVNAFIQRNIPFFDSQLTEESQAIQRALYDLLNILAGWEAVGLKPEHLSEAGALALYWNRAPLSISEREAFVQANNWHLTRWLETLLHHDERDIDLSGWRRSAEDLSLVWALPFWLAPRQAPPVVRDAIAQLATLYGNWLEQRSCLSLMIQAVSYLLPEPFLSAVADSGPLLSELSLAPLVAFQEELSQLEERYRKATEQVLPLAHLLEHYDALWAPTSFKTEKNRQSGVRVLSLHESQGEAFVWVAIPFLVDGEFPYRRELIELVAPEVWERLGCPVPSGENEAEERRLLALGMTRAKSQLVLSTHRRVDVDNLVDTVLPSPFYVELLAEKRRLLGNPSPVLICECHTKEKPVAACDVQHIEVVLTINPDADVQTESPLARYSSQSAWALLDAQPDEPVFESDAILATSPTAISAYMTCPRQYYYKHQLSLPQRGTVSASLGTLAHKVMELFNSQTLPGAYTVERLADLAEALFCFEMEPERFLLAGYGEREKRELTAMSPLAVDALRTRLLASIEDLRAKGYFDRYGSMKAAYAELALRDVEIEGLERCRLKGKMDAVIQLADDTWEVVDYKTYGVSKYAAKWSTCEQHFQRVLEPLPGETGLTHRERFSDKVDLAYPVDYQLLLYYLACRQDPRFQGKLAGISLQLVRPPFAKDPEQGSIRLAVDAEAIEASRAELLADIQRYIIDPILGSQVFPADPASGMACGYCAYAGICEGAQAEDELGGGE